MTKLMTLFCLPQNDNISKSTDQKSISLEGTFSVHRQGCFQAPPWLHAVGLLMVEPFSLMWGLLWCRRICRCQFCMLYSATAVLGLTAEKCKKAKILEMLGQIHPCYNNAVGLCLYLLTFKYGGGFGCFQCDFYCEMEKRNASNTSAICSCFGPSF